MKNELNLLFIAPKQNYQTYLTVVYGRDYYTVEYVNNKVSKDGLLIMDKNSEIRFSYGRMEDAGCRWFTPSYEWKREFSETETYGQVFERVCKKALAKLIQKQNKTILAGRNHPAWKFMKEIADAKMTGYKEYDVYRSDCLYMAEHPATEYSFYWAVGESSAHIATNFDRLYAEVGKSHEFYFWNCDWQKFCKWDSDNKIWVEFMEEK